MSRELQPEKLHEQARCILEKVTLMAPNGSHNIAKAIHCFSSLADIPIEQIERNIKAEIKELETHEELSDTERKNLAECYLTLKTINTLSKKRTTKELFLKELQLKNHWYARHEKETMSMPREEILESDESLSLLSKLEASDLSYVERHMLVNIFKLYRWVEEHKAGTCGALSSAGAIIALRDEPSIPEINILAGDNFTHVFLLLGHIHEKLKSSASFTIADLPETCLIVDPWTRCKFAPEDAATYWKTIFATLNLTSEDLDPEDITTYCKCPH